MAWSTREIADLAGTTVNTVRHYHRVGLLEQPDRMANGYKQYQVRHLVRLLQILRLRDLGVPLDQVEQVGVSGDSAATALRAIDADLEKSIERLQRARAEIRAILHGASATDVPPGFEDVVGQLTANDRSLMLIYAQLYDDDAMTDVRQMLEAERTDEPHAFDTLPPDADEATRQAVAEQYASTISKALEEYPWLSDPVDHLKKSPKVTRETFLESVRALYNPAQLDVIARAGLIVQGQPQQVDPPSDDAHESRNSE